MTYYQYTKKNDMPGSKLKKESKKMGVKKIKSRVHPRKEVQTLHVPFLKSLEDLSKIAKDCEIIQASASGMLIQVSRENLIPQQLRKNLNLDILIGKRVFMNLDELNLEISGKIARTQLNGKKGFYIAIDYSEEAPEYWRECLIDLLPKPGEID